MYSVKDSENVRRWIIIRNNNNYKWTTSPAYKHFRGDHASVCLCVESIMQVIIWRLLAVADNNKVFGKIIKTIDTGQIWLIS